jgi:hypothetical protein
MNGLDSVAEATVAIASCVEWRRSVNFYVLQYRRSSNQHSSQYFTTLYIKAKRNSRTKYSNLLKNSFLWPYKLRKSVNLDAFFVCQAAI